VGGNALAGKPLIAVLGLEIGDGGGTPTKQDTDVAKQLTEGLRSRAKAGSGPYQIAGNSDKELIDEKLLKNCDTEAAACMSQIGGDLGADILMYGKIEKSGRTYTVTMKLLDVHRRAVEKSSNDPIPFSQATNEADLQRWAKTIYAKLTGQTSSGQILVKVSNAERGTILVNGEEKANITNGLGQVSGLEEGKYKLAVESEGFHRWEDTVGVRPGETTNVPVKLEKMPSGGPDIGAGPGASPGGGGPIVGGGGGGSKRGSQMWKGVFVGSVLVGLVGGGVWLYGKNQLDDAHDSLRNGCGYANDLPAGCSNGTVTPLPKSGPKSVDSYNAQGDSGHTKTLAGGITVGVAGAVAVIALYEGFIAKHDDASRKEYAEGHRVHRDRFVVTPMATTSSS
jgi:hypothetical protein